AIEAAAATSGTSRRATDAPLLMRFAPFGRRATGLARTSLPMYRSAYEGERLGRLFDPARRSSAGVMLRSPQWSRSEPTGAPGARGGPAALAVFRRPPAPPPPSCPIQPR